MQPERRDTRSRRSILRGAGAVGGLIGATGLSSATPGRSPGPKQTELLVGINDEYARSSANGTERTAREAVPADATVVHSNEQLEYVAIEVPAELPSEAVEHVRDVLDSNDAIEYVEENATLQSLYTPNDPYYDSQHAPQQVNCEDAWAETLGDEDVTIAVVDQGVEYEHENLSGNVDDRIGEVFVGRGSDPGPLSRGDTHGTLVAGIAAGETGNGTGQAGISNCSLLAARALDEQGQGALSDIADAIQWAADEGVDVINLSLGSSSGLWTLENACEYATERGCLVVAAAGNSGGSVMYPAAYDDVLAVSALTSRDRLASFSNRGPEIDLAAPGQNLLSTTLNDGYDRISGTSAAAPVVAGVAGLVRSVYPGLSSSALREHLRETAVDVGLRSAAQGAGRVDAGNAVTTVPEGYDGPDERDGDTDEDEEDDEDDEETDTDGHLLSFVTEPEASFADYEFTATGPVEFTTAPGQTPSGGTIEGGTYAAEDYIEEDDETWHAGGVTGGGQGDAFSVEGAITSIEVGQPDVMWVELDGERLSPEEVIEETTGDDTDETDGGEEDESDETDETDEPQCGDETNTARVEGDLDGSGWWPDTARWQYTPQTENPCELTLTVDGPSGADVELYMTRDGRRPTQWDADESATATGDTQSLTTALESDDTVRILITATGGSGTYELEIVEQGY
ncbi:serine protease halolysin [Natrialba magadii ATCC 43099]|uniref:Peptidase S8 and S53 subtilisin kexin sedolisin n=1 Tax=Natrialba magadii (strain ATCC 43099 / DSM 3394 / CCM 3739 / CIP 104546 / IAM 13178 / JCM 8861 / NBRC 102185 / NCIMB 2190 / MS3) TaxID=547559 RepID=D3SZG5_NATMM|nr:S8 family serine peptidase [Natrialba magadii]ADD04299.1 serine protease halolysin [Natrialba magadii ATCC 43099]ELY26701.1 peptidase S8 and S53 subtilisin kexin sedolisin [Natrialba magadii ATCC 43099]